MGAILHLLSYATALFGAAFGTLCLACGLYYIAEFVEEYTVWTKKLILRTTYVVLALHVISIVDGLPVMLCLFSMGCHLFYSLLLRDFPYIYVSDPVFIVSMILVLVDHFVWFSHFTSSWEYQFSEVSTFFVFNVWLVPFMYFISLSATENALPNFSNTLSFVGKFHVDVDEATSPSSESSRRSKKMSSMLKQFINVVLQKKDDVKSKM